MTYVIVKVPSHPGTERDDRDDGQNASGSRTPATRAHGAQRGTAHPPQGRVGDWYEGDRPRGGRASRISPALLSRRQRGACLGCLALDGRRIGATDKAMPPRAGDEDT